MIVDRPQGNKLTGFFRGTVVKHLTHGRCKVWVPGVYPESIREAWSKLPDAEQISPLFGGSNEGNGTFSYPNIGATVVCGFWNGDQNLPFFFGAVLGGSNAFGQYETVKTPQEDVSPRHMVTAGKTQVELHEPGVLSAVVCNPAKTLAFVDFQHDSLTQHVESRPRCEEMYADAIPNANCQIVADVNVNRGEVSSSTHYYDFSVGGGTVELTAQGVVSSMSYDRSVQSDTSELQNGCGTIYSGQKYYGRDSSSVTTANAKTSESETSAYQEQRSAWADALQDNAGGATQYSNVSAYALSEQYNYLNGNTNRAVVRTSQFNSDGNCTDTVRVDGSMIRQAVRTVCRKDKYADSATQQTITLDETNTLTNREVFGECEFEASTGLTRDYDLKKQTSDHIRQQTDKRIAKHAVVLRGGFSVSSSLNDDEKYVSGAAGGSGMTIRTVVKNENDVSSNTTSDKSNVRVFSKAYKEQGTNIKHIECLNLLNSDEGKLTVKIQDIAGKTGCTLTMDAQGNVTIDASQSINMKAGKSISIKAPTITLAGDAYKSNFQTVTASATNISVTGSDGDIKVSNVSLKQHAHLEMQSGDVVSPGSVKTQTAADSN